jgi:hypothetical protein
MKRVEESLPCLMIILIGVPGKAIFYIFYYPPPHFVFINSSSASLTKNILFS